MSVLEEKKNLAIAIALRVPVNISSAIHRNTTFAVFMSAEQTAPEAQAKTRYSMSSVVVIGVGIAAAAFLVRLAPAARFEEQY